MAKEKSDRLIVNYLPESIKENHLRELFSTIGQLKSCQLIKDKQTGNSLGFAFIEYFNGEKDGKLACEKFNGLTIGEKKILVRPARPQSNEFRNTKLSIQGFPNSFDQQEFNQLFSPFGQIIQIRILKDKLIAFIIMSTHSEAQNAKDHLHAFQINSNHFLNINFVQKNSNQDQISSSSSSSSMKIPSIYVYGLGQNVTKSDLSKLFSEFGNVSRVDLIMDKNTGLCKGYGFVFINEYNQAINAIQQLNNSIFHDRHLQVRFQKNSINNQINY